MADRTSDMVASIREKHGQVQEAIAAAARRAGRSPDAVRLVVVTKSQPLRVVQAAVDAGIRILGENYAEEAVAKIQALQARPMATAAVEWHMIGHVQGRKAKLVAQYFDLIHSLDSLRLAGRLDLLAAKIGRQLAVLLEFNVGGEAEKRGWPASEESGWHLLLDEVEAIAGLPNLKVQGLMTMPPISNDPEGARVYFRRLRKLQGFLGERIPKAKWGELSMGTSADYAVAVEEGATLVRVGEAILGARPAREPT